MDKLIVPFSTGSEADFSSLIGKTVHYQEAGYGGSGYEPKTGEVVGWCRNRSNDPCLVVARQALGDPEVQIRMVSLFDHTVTLPDQPKPTP